MKWEERKIRLANNDILVERYKHHGIDFLEGYIQCLFNQHHIDLKEAIGLILQANKI